MTTTQIGIGRLTWARIERQSDRYGTVGFDDDAPLTELPEARGRLIAEVLAVRPSEHIGDLFRGIVPTTPSVGDRIVLGEGTLFFGDVDGLPSVGLRPDDERETDWLDPRQLYRAHDQTVRLVFETDDRRQGDIHK